MAFPRHNEKLYNLSIIMAILVHLPIKRTVICAFLAPFFWRGGAKNCHINLLVIKLKYDMICQNIQNKIFNVSKTKCVKKNATSVLW